MTQYNWGVIRAESIIRRSPQQIEYWLDRAKRGRRRWKTRLIRRRKRLFLDGFIAKLEGYLVTEQSMGVPRPESEMASPGSAPIDHPIESLPPEVVAPAALEVSQALLASTPSVDSDASIHQDQTGTKRSPAAARLRTRRMPRPGSLKIPSSLEQALISARRTD